LKPIENVWSKLKQLLRAAKARTTTALETAPADALNAITAENTATWPRHRGYRVQQL
jgi:hypothetical protein